MPESLSNEPRPMHLVSELARATRMHPVSVYRLISSGKIKAERIGGVLRISDREYRRLTGDDSDVTV